MDSQRIHLGSTKDRLRVCQGVTVDLLRNLMIFTKDILTIYVGFAKVLLRELRRNKAITKHMRSGIQVDTTGLLRGYKQVQRGCEVDPIEMQRGRHEDKAECIVNTKGIEKVYRNM